MRGVAGEKGTLTGLIVPQSPNALEDHAAGRDAAFRKGLSALTPDRLGSVDTILNLSPHWIPESHFAVNPAPAHRTRSDFEGYNVDLSCEAPGDPALAHALIEAGRAEGLPVRASLHHPDHSAAVPLKFLFSRRPRESLPLQGGGAGEGGNHRLRSRAVSLIPLSSSELPLDTALAWGKTIRRAVESSGKKVLLLSGGGLSHNLTACLHWEESLAAAIYDHKVLQLLQRGKGTEAAALDRYWLHAGNPPAGLSDLFIFLGAVGPETRFDLHAYDAAPGVGWALLTPSFGG